MTFAARQHTPTSGGPVGIGTFLIADYTLPDSVGITFNIDGTTTVNGYREGGPTNWYTPTTTGIGSSYDVRFTLQSGNAWDAGLTSGTAYNLGTARTLTWSSSAGDKAATVAVEILLAGTSTVAYTATISAGLYEEP